MHELLAVEGTEVAVASGGLGILGVLAYLGAWVRSLLKDNAELKLAANTNAQTIDVSKGEERRKDAAAKQAHELTLYEQASDRIDKLEARDEEKTQKIIDLTSEISSCKSDRESLRREGELLRREVGWLRTFVGAPAMPESPSGVHRPIPGYEGADQ